MDLHTVLVTGGAGYVGSALVPKLLGRGYAVRVLDLYLYGEDMLGAVAGDPNLRQIKGDIRDRALVNSSVGGCDAIIHLACISNDPSFELDSRLGKSINYDAFFGLVESARQHGVRRFVYASSSSVYGVKSEPDVTEDLALEPLTDYSRYKALCEQVLLEAQRPGFVPLVLRPATVCGYAPRLRLDLTVNLLTAQAFHNRRITVFGGDQVRPNIHIEDVCELYVQSLDWPDVAVDGRIFNAGWENRRVREIAELVREVVGADVEIVTVPTQDHRSYQICSEKIRRELGFEPRRTITDAIRDLVAAFDSGRVPNALTDRRYYNIRTMQCAAASLQGALAT